MIELIVGLVGGWFACKYFNRQRQKQWDKRTVIVGIIDINERRVIRNLRVLLRGRTTLKTNYLSSLNGSRGKCVFHSKIASQY